MPEVSVPAAVTIDDSANLTNPVWANAEQSPDTVQFLRRLGGDVDGSRGWTHVTCRRFRDDVVAVARGLIANGIEPGTRVGLMSSTRYEWTVVDYAVMSVGAVTVPIYETASPDQAAWTLSDSGATACVVETADHARLVDGVRGGLPGLTQVWQIDRGDLDRLRADGDRVDPAEVERRRGAIRGNDLATIIYTSGTTGRPKGCMITHRNLQSDVANAIAALPDLFNERASTLLFLPLAHVFARLIQAGVVQTRATMGHSAEMDRITDELKSFRPTFVLAVPRVFEKIRSGATQRAREDGREDTFRRAEQVAVQYSEALERDGGPGVRLRMQHLLFDRLVYRKLRAGLGNRCRTAIVGGAPLNPQLGHFFRGAGVTIYEGYGLTETSAAVTANQPRGTRIGTVGPPLPGVAIRIDTDGEILIKSDSVFPGYWNNPEATAETLSDGWLRSGDLGQLDSDGFLKVTGRKKEIIVTAGGKHVVPAALEERIREHPLVSQIVVLGDQRPFVSALVTIDESAWPKWLAEHGHPRDNTVDELRDDPPLRAEIQSAIDAANRTVSHPEQIKTFRILPTDFTESANELTPTLKVKRDVVQQTRAPEVAAIYGK
ncbi:long-chain acyl-CoA synthetase [Micromonospora pattaloongensis]|uniref:Acyl-CoA synthetase n=1 Tax=Micromonospora pattaloongensis TaxID=405436 RepID=A0A1H3RUF8_9ACTN|nr:long-chain fatty acid--CoA ligase [Micromonospora pattaloongensis]SDZ29334.1 long-chain acyl-CoA synthetase [Micromonospora pattaloongensis]